MNDRLSGVIGDQLAADVPADVHAAAHMLQDTLGGIAVLFYGSVLRTRALEDVLDFYVLTERRAPRWSWRRWLWPDVSYHEIAVGDACIRAKVATMPLAVFERAVSGRTLDTTVWVRFAQPCALASVSGGGYRRRVEAAVTQAITTAARFAAALGPRSGGAGDYWRALLRETYRAEFRVEKPGRETQILAHDPERYDRLLPLAWEAGAVRYEQADHVLSPDLGRERKALITAWRIRAAFGKPLNLARLVKAAFTFEGAARYGLWKIERHTGVKLELTPWRERHPVLAGPGVLWRVLRAGGR